MKHLKWLLGIALAMLVLKYPDAAAAGALRGAAQWYANVAPALFPFMALLPLITCREALEVYEKWLGGPMRTLFGLPGAAAPALVTGMLAGSPAGALAVRRAAANSQMSEGQVERLAVATCGLSPAYLIGGIGACLLGDPAKGRMLLRAQILTQLSLAWLFRGSAATRAKTVNIIEETRDDPSVRGAVLVVLGVCGYMALFGAIARAASRLIGDTAGRVLICLLDLPSGAAVAAQSVPTAWRLPVLAGMCGFGGACIMAQNIGVLRDCGLRPVRFCAFRLLAAIMNAGFVWINMTLSIHFSKFSDVSPLQISAIIAIILTVPAIWGLKNQIIYKSKQVGTA